MIPFCPSYPREINWISTIETSVYTIKNSTCDKAKKLCNTPDNHVKFYTFHLFVYGFPVKISNRLNIVVFLNKHHPNKIYEICEICANLPRQIFLNPT